MDMKDFYHGQRVSESDLDAAFQYVEDMEHLMAQDWGMAPALATASPDCTVYGGIQSGGVVTKNSPTKVNVTACVGRDTSGRYVYCPASTVLLTRQGATTEGESTDATGSGALVAIVNEAWMSLWLVYDESLSDPRTDATGSTVYFDIEESFHFHLALGTDAAVATVPATLVNNRLLLADILLDAAGEIRSILGNDAICGTNEEFDDLGAPYNGMSGRRADWAAFENPTDFPLYAAADMALREGTPREALRRLLIHLQNATAPAGSRLIGSDAQAGAGAAYAAYAPKTLTQGSVNSQLIELLDAINQKLSRGGDTVRPQSGYSGLIFDPEDMNEPEALLGIKAELAGSTEHFARIKRHGHFTLPHVFYEDFLEARGTAAGLRTELQSGDNQRWDVSTNGANSKAYLRNYNDGAPNTGGIVELYTHAGANSWTLAIAGNGDANSRILYKVHESPWAIISVRFRIASTVSNLRLRAGLMRPGSTQIGVYLEIDTSVDALVHAVAHDGANRYAGDLGIAVPDTWGTLRIWIATADIMYAQLNNSTVVQITSGANPNLTDTNPHQPALYFETLDATSRAAYVDKILIADHKMQSDEL